MAVTGFVKSKCQRFDASMTPHPYILIQNTVSGTDFAVFISTVGKNRDGGWERKCVEDDDRRRWAERAPSPTADVAG